MKYLIKMHVPARCLNEWRIQIQTMMWKCFLLFTDICTINFDADWTPDGVQINLLP